MEDSVIRIRALDEGRISFPGCKSDRFMVSTFTWQQGQDEAGWKNEKRKTADLSHRAPYHHYQRENFSGFFVTRSYGCYCGITFLPWNCLWL